MKNDVAPYRPRSRPVFVNSLPVEKDSWSHIPNLSQHPELDKMAQKISKLVHDGLTVFDLTLSRFTRRIQPLQFHKRLIDAYTGVNDSLRVSKDNLPADSLNKRSRKLVKVTRGQVIPEISKDICVNGNCPPVSYT
jgi:hypothetical protein